MALSPHQRYTAVWTTIVAGLAIGAAVVVGGGGVLVYLVIEAGFKALGM